MPPLADEDHCCKQIATQKFCKAKISVAQSTVILLANLSFLGKTAPLQQGPASVVSERCGRNVTHWSMAATSAGLPTPVSTLCSVPHSYQAPLGWVESKALLVVWVRSRAGHGRGRDAAN